MHISNEELHKGWCQWDENQLCAWVWEVVDGLGHPGQW